MLSFLKVAPKAIMNLELWKLSLGMMNVPKSDHLAKQIFRSMDSDRDGFVASIIQSRYSLRIILPSLIY
jgi:hypothetical protein